MNSKTQTKASAWPVSVTLLLCVLFSMAIGIKWRSDIANLNNQTFDTLQKNAALSINEFDANLAAAETSLNLNNETAISLLSKAGELVQLSNLLAFDINGQISTSSSDDKDFNAEVTKELVGKFKNSPLVTDISSVKNGSGQLVPVYFAKAKDGSFFAAEIKVPPLLRDVKGQFLVLSDEEGKIFFATKESKFSNSENIFPLLGLKIKTSILSPQFTKSQFGEFAAAGQPGRHQLAAFVGIEKRIYNTTYFKITLFYAMLFTGPVLAFFGIWFVLLSQDNRFNVIRTKMQEAEKRLRIAIDGAKCGVWDWNLAEDYVILTERLADTLSLAGAGRYHTVEVLNSLQMEDRAKLRQALQNALTSGDIDIVVKTLPRQIGSKEFHGNHLQLRGKTSRNEDNSTIRIIGVSIDVSDQVASENRLVSAEKRLREAIDSMSGPFALWSRDGELLLWNESFTNNFELDSISLHVGSKYREVSRMASKAVTTRNRDEADPQTQQIALNNGTWLKMVERRTFEGGLVSIGIDVTPQVHSQQKIQNSEAQLRKAVEKLQISEREAAELAAQYEIAKNRAEKASASKDSFLANMSHELRTPLNAINGFSQMMVQQIYGPLGDARYVGYAQDILASGKHLLDLINDVLDMAKIEAGKFKIYPQPMSLNDTIKQAIRVIRGRAEEKKINIEVDTGEIDEMTGDSRAIKQIILNLLSNSIKFTESGGRILIRTRPKNNAVVISVIDTGIGIAEEHIPRLGQAFVQVESEHARSNQGTGLGLALCRSFAQMHGGNVTISSKLGVGTKIDVTLPRVAMVREAA